MTYDQKLADAEAAIEELEESKAERRRYALLQAAATVWKQADSGSPHWAVDEAELLLAEIERREKETP